MAPCQEKYWNFHLKWSILVNSEWYFFSKIWGTICISVPPLEILGRLVPYTLCNLCPCRSDLPLVQQVLAILLPRDPCITRVRSPRHCCHNMEAPPDSKCWCGPEAVSLPTPGSEPSKTMLNNWDLEFTPSGRKHVIGSVAGWQRIVSMATLYYGVCY